MRFVVGMTGSPMFSIFVLTSRICMGDVGVAITRIIRASFMGCFRSSLCLDVACGISTCPQES